MGRDRLLAHAVARRAGAAFLPSRLDDPNERHMKTGAAKQNRWARWVKGALLAAFIVALSVGTWRNPHFWMTADQRGDLLFRKKQFAQAARAYADPWRIGTAQYRNGDFEA